MAVRRWTGTITKFVHARGYGFAKIDGLPGRKDALVVIAEFPSHVGVWDLHQGTRIAFFISQGERGLSCVRCNII